MNRNITIAKYISIGAFLVLLFATYYLRSQVLELNTIRFSSENIRADENIKDLKESYPLRTAQHEMQMKQYDIQMDHYKSMLELFNTDYDEYVKRKKDHFAPPQLPRKPQKPRSPELSDKLAGINAEFRGQQFHYFDMTSMLNWVACAAALALVGGLLYLLMFDVEGQRLFYLAVLILSFVFMIGPSFHSIMSAIVGFLRPPHM
ncbi:MAG: hypothetical protein HN919_04585 [Verrucomicrobia bacterium]|jgi:hypothetical protein|nr:hypothetical protein [Verrucomicrobiota bacterium]